MSYATKPFHCIEAIQLGFEIMVAERRHEIEWEEDNLTYCLVETIKETDFLGHYQISINYQSPIISRAIAFEGANAKLAPRVDFKFAKFFSKKEHDYYAGAKNLSERDWAKADGARVSASDYRARYIDTGIENFLSGRYPEGLLVGYIVNGKEENIVNSLNRLIDSRKIAPRIGIICKDTTTSFSICYFSENQLTTGMITIRHLLLQLA